MKNYYLFLFLFIVSFPVFALEGSDAILKQLNEAIKNKQHYVKIKEERILNFKKIKSDNLTKEQEYNFNKTLYLEYQKLNSDSAIQYVKKNIKIAEALQNKELLNLAQLQLVTLYSSSGKYRESEAILKGINKKNASSYITAKLLYLLS